MRETRLVLWHRIVLIVVALFVSGYCEVDLNGSEFSGGKISGLLIILNEIGFVAGIFVIFLHLVGVHEFYYITFFSSLCSSALYVYLLTPIVFDSPFSNFYVSSTNSAFSFDGPAVVGLLNFLAISVLTFRRRRPRRAPHDAG